MKKITLFFILLFYSCFSQEVCHRVTYKIVLANTLNLKKEEKNQRDLFIEDVKRNLDLIEYELFFTKNQSLFQRVEKIELENESFAYKRAKNFVSGIYFKDSVLKTKLVVEEIEGNNFNILRDFEEYKWQILNETKEISGYKCYKAICVYEEFDKKREKHLLFTPEVWFTPSIPNSSGPRGLDGLPGLVLEGRFNDKMTFCATKIELYPNCNILESFNYQKDKYKYISQEEYQNLLIQLNEKLRGGN